MLPDSVVPQTGRILEIRATIFAQEGPQGRVHRFQMKTELLLEGEFLRTLGTLIDLLQKRVLSLSVLVQGAVVLESFPANVAKLPIKVVHVLLFVSTLSPSSVHQHVAILANQLLQAGYIVVPFGLVGRELFATIFTEVHNAVIMNFKMLFENFGTGECFYTIVTLEVALLRNRISRGRSVDEIGQGVARSKNAVVTIFVQTNDILVLETRDNDPALF